MSRTRFRSRKQITRLIKAIPTYLVILINIQTGSDFFNRNIHYYIRVKQARFSQKRHLTYLCRTILILAALLGETCEQLFARFLFKPEFINRFCWFSMTHMETVGLQNIQIWTKSDRNYGCESAAEEKYKMAALTSSNWDLNNLRKINLAHVLETTYICVKL